MEQNFADWIGRSVTREDTVTPRLVAEYRAAMGRCLHDPPGTDHCPPGLHWGLAPAMPSYGDVGPDGAEAKGVFLPPIPLPRRMWAGGSIETLRPLRIGQHIQRSSAVSDIKFREGGAGNLYLVSISHVISAADGLLLRERQDVVFRGGAPKEVSAPQSPPPSEGVAWTVEPSPLLLFRFSAFTFNGHRIHYDAPYAMEEGYSGLVVHGPLQAALMLNLASFAMGEVPRRFEYRCVAPLFGGHPFTVRRDAGTSPLATRILRHDGVTTAIGQAHARET